MNRKNLTALIAATAIGFAAVGGASTVVASEDDDQASAQAALEATISSVEALAKVEAETGGRVIELEFEIEDGKVAYEVEVVMSDGTVTEMLLDASTGELLPYSDDHDCEDSDDEDGAEDTDNG